MTEINIITIHVFFSKTSGLEQKREHWNKKKAISTDSARCLLPLRTRIPRAGAEISSPKHTWKPDRSCTRATAMPCPASPQRHLPRETIPTPPERRKAQAPWLRLRHEQKQNNEKIISSRKIDIFSDKNHESEKKYIDLKKKHMG